jgi:RNA polymerase sigma-70 factor (ECF subfamily)
VDERTDEDAALMLRVATGDTAAFAALYDRHHRSVARFAHRIVQDAGKAEELTQDIFVKLYRHAGRYRPTARFKTFLFRVAANHCLNELRRGEYRVRHVTEQGRRAGPWRWPRRRPTLPSGRRGPGARGDGGGGAATAERARADRLRALPVRGNGVPRHRRGAVGERGRGEEFIHRATLSVARAVEAWQAGARGPTRSEA